MSRVRENGGMRITPRGVAELGVVLVAAGRGERLGAGLPKAFVELGGRTLLEHAIRTVTALPRPGQLVLVVPDTHAAEALRIAEQATPRGSHWQVSAVHGGRERHESVRFGLEALHDSIATVLVHDAARPLTPVEVFERVLAAVHESGTAVVPAIPVADTLKRRDGDGVVIETVDRTSLVAVQTPQGFPREELEAAHAALAERGGEGPRSDPGAGGAPTDDAEVVQRAGGTVRTVAGSQRAHKLTTPDDLLVLEGFIAGGAGR